VPSSFSSTRAGSVSGKERKGALDKDMHIAPIQAKCAEQPRAGHPDHDRGQGSAYCLLVDTESR